MHELYVSEICIYLYVENHRSINFEWTKIDLQKIEFLVDLQKKEERYGLISIFFLYICNDIMSIGINIASLSDNMSDISVDNDDILIEYEMLEDYYKAYLIDIKSVDKTELDIVMPYYNVHILKSRKLIFSSQYIKNFLYLTYGSDNMNYKMFSYLNALYKSNIDDFVIDESIILKFKLVSHKNKIKSQIINNMSLKLNNDYIIINNIYFFKPGVLIKLINQNKRYIIDYNKILVYYDLYLKEFLDKMEYVII